MRSMTDDPIWYLTPVRDHVYALVNNTGSAAFAIEVTAHGTTLIGPNRHAVHRRDRVDAGEQIEFPIRTEIWGANPIDQGVNVGWNDDETNPQFRKHAVCLIARTV